MVVTMRTILALPVFYVVARAPQIGAFLVGSGLLVLLSQGEPPIASGLVLLVLALLGSAAVGLACTLPVLITATGSRRAVRDACWEAADDVADWAGWETGPPNP